MKSVKVRDAKAEFSALVEAAERGQPTTITKHGRPAAVIVPVEDARKLYPERRRDLLSFFFPIQAGSNWNATRRRRFASSSFERFPFGHLRPVGIRSGSARTSQDIQEGGQRLTGGFVAIVLHRRRASTALLLVC